MSDHEITIPWDWMPLLWTTAQTVAGVADPDRIADALPAAYVILGQTMEEMKRNPRPLPMSPGWTMSYSAGSGRFVLRGSENAEITRDGSAQGSLRIVK